MTARKGEEPFVGVTLFQARVLMNAALELDWTTIYQLNDYAKVSPSSQPYLTQLVRAGFLNQQHGPVKGSVYRITPAGRELVALLKRLNRAKGGKFKTPGAAGGQS